MTAHATYRIQAVTAAPDLRVKRVAAFPDRPGEWQVVSAGEDFTAQLVDSAPDLRIQWVEAFPGCP